MNVEGLGIYPDRSVPDEPSEPVHFVLTFERIPDSLQRFDLVESTRLAAARVSGILRLSCRRKTHDPLREGRLSALQDPV